MFFPPWNNTMKTKCHKKKSSGFLRINWLLFDVFVSSLFVCTAFLFLNGRQIDPEEKKALDWDWAHIAIFVNIVFVRRSQSSLMANLVCCLLIRLTWTAVSRRHLLRPDVRLFLKTIGANQVNKVNLSVVFESGAEPLKKDRLCIRD